MAKSLLETPWAIAIDPARRDGRIVAESAEPERAAKPVAMPRSLDRGLVEALARVGIERLYSHQREALKAAVASNLVITSGTASGKSLAFNLPVLDGIARDPKRRALYLYPTKALAQDQARKLALLRPPGLREAIYDGDTPREERPAIRRRNNLVLTNPDMLHVGLLPHHKSWGDFLANLGWVVVDEAHTYRGVFGSHVANVLRRLRRVARAYGSEPRFLLASATIANPVELAERLVGDAVRADRRRRRAAQRARDRDVEPAADRQGERDAALGALRGGGPAGRARLPGSADDLLPQKPPRDRADPALRPRRPGARAASPSWRRGSPPTAAATRRSSGARSRRGWRRASCSPSSRPTRSSWGSTSASSTRRSASPSPAPWRACARCGAGRGGGGAGSPSTSPAQDALDQFFCRHPDEFLGRPVEAAILDHASEQIASRHLVAAAYELPLSAEDDEVFGAGWRERAERLVAAGELRRAGGRLLPRSSEFVASKIPLRSASADSVAVIERDSGEMLGLVEAERAFTTIHPGAVYLHLGRSYEVEQLDIEGRRAIVSRFDGDWYTRPKKETEIYIERVREQRSVAGVELHFGEVSVTEQVIAFQRVSISEQEPIDIVALELPEQHFVTQALWYVLPDRLSGALPPDVLLGALHATEHGQIAVLPLIAMCDRWDIGGLSTNVHFQTGRATIFIYDGHPGGVGITLRGYEQFERLLGDAERLIAECPCESGCPSCVQSPKCGNLNEPLHKAGALELMGAMQGSGRR